MTMRPEPYRHLESDAIFDALEAFERKAAELGVTPGGLALAWALGGAGSVVSGPAATGAPRPGPRCALARALRRPSRDEVGSLFPC